MVKYKNLNYLKKRPSKLTETEILNTDLRSKQVRENFSNDQIKALSVD